MRKKGKKVQQKKRHNRGAAMIVVVCVMMVVTILSLTLLMSAYQMFATVNDEGKDELYYQQAMSFSEVLRARLDPSVSSGTTVALTDELKTHIDDFMASGEQKETLKASAPSGSAAYGGITLTLDKSLMSGFLIVRIAVVDGETPMAGCTCKYQVKQVSGAWS